MIRWLGFFIAFGFLSQLTAREIYLPDSLQRKFLKVAVYDAAPFGLLYEDGSFGGMMVELWEDIADELDLDYHFILTDMEDLISGLHQGRYDIGLGAISITPNREMMVDFTQPVNPSGTGIATNASSLRSTIDQTWKPILLSLLRLFGLLLLMLLVFGTLVWLIERGLTHANTDRKLEGFWDGLWWSAVTVTTVGYGDKVPHSRAGKLIAIAWIFMGIILVSLFTANASSILTSVRLKSHIETKDHLRYVAVGAVSNSSGEEFLIREHIGYVAYPDILEAMDDLKNGKLDAVVSNVPVLQHLKHHVFGDKIVISSRLLLKNNMGIALQPKSPYKEPLDRILLQKITEPKWQQSVYNYLGED